LEITTPIIRAAYGAESALTHRAVPCQFLRGSVRRQILASMNRKRNAMGRVAWVSGKKHNLLEIIATSADSTAQLG
jgi:hypothetical protein